MVRVMGVHFSSGWLPWPPAQGIHRGPVYFDGDPLSEPLPPAFGPFIQPIICMQCGKDNLEHWFTEQGTRRILCAACMNWPVTDVLQCFGLCVNHKDD